MQPDAAMRCGATEIFGFVGAVNGVAAEEEDRIGHRRAAIDRRGMIAEDAGRPECADWRAVARPCGRHPPRIARYAVDKDIHALAGDMILATMPASARLGAARTRQGSAACSSIGRRM